MEKYFNEYLRTLRKSKNLTQAQVADALGIKTSTYAHMELDGKKISVEMLKKLSELFAVPIGDLTEPQDINDDTIHFKELNTYLTFSDNELLTKNTHPTSIADLRYEEQNMVLWYRMLPVEQREKVLNYISKTLKNEYKKTNP